MEKGARWAGNRVLRGDREGVTGVLIKLVKNEKREGLDNIHRVSRNPLRSTISILQNTIHSNCVRV